MILLWGLLDDDEMAAVHARLRERNARLVVVDQRAVRHNEIDLSVDDGVDGRLTVPGLTVDLHDISAVYLRPGDARRLPEVWSAGPESSLWAHARAFDQTLWAWSELCDTFVVSRPDAMSAAHSKPYQSSIIQAAGFCVPETITTTDRAAVVEFWERHTNVVYKSMGTTRSVVARLTVAHLDRLDDVATCPTQFQRWIPGIDHRVHVVGEEVFASTIASPADDYRYPSGFDPTARIERSPLPEECAERCRQLASAMHLPVVGIDLRLSVDGQWYCFEVNPSPAFTYYDGAQRGRIARAIAKLMMTRAAPHLSDGVRST